MKPIVVYLAGGFKSGWQDKVKEACKDLSEKGLVIWQDPRENNTSDPAIYGPMDRMKVDSSEIIFGFAEKDNPLPFPLFYEMGYGLGSKKRVIFVNEITDVNDKRYRPFLFPTVFGSIVTRHDLESGINELKRVLTAWSADPNPE